MSSLRQKQMWLGWTTTPPNYISFTVKRHLAVFYALLFSCIAVLLAAGLCRAGAAAIVLSAEIRPYLEAREGLLSELGGVEDVFSLKTNPELVKSLLQEKSYRAVVAIGPEAAEFLYKTPIKTATPVVLMVLDPEKFLGQSSLCGVDLRIPFSEQFQVITEKMGKGLRIGIPFSPKENQSWVEKASVSALAQGCTLFSIPVRSREEVAAQINAAYRSIDVLLFIPDSVVIAESLVSYLIKDAMKHGVSSVGFNSFFLRAGAVLSFNLDYRKTGVLAANIIEERQAGSDCRLLAPAYEVGWSEKVWQLIPSFREGGAR